jgi:hypothetical protein
MFEQVCAEEYFKYVQGRAVFELFGNFYLSLVLWKKQVSESCEFFSFHPNSKSVFARLGMALRVLFLPLSGLGCTVSSSASSVRLLLLKGEFATYVSLSRSSLKLPSSESESFTISLILSVPINFFVKYFLK